MLIFVIIAVAVVGFATIKEVSKRLHCEILLIYSRTLYPTVHSNSICNAFYIRLAFPFSLFVFPRGYVYCNTNTTILFILMIL